MDSVIDLEAQQVAESMTPAGAFSPLSHHRRSGNGPQGVEGAERHEMDILGPHISSVASPLRSVSTGQDTNDGAQPIVSQAEGGTPL